MNPISSPQKSGILAVLTALLLSGCLVGGDDGASVATERGTVGTWGTYSYSEGHLLLSHRSGHYECDTTGTISRLVIDSGQFEEHVSIQGNQWDSWEPYLDTLRDDSNIVAVIQHGERYTRVGEGTGMLGEWRLINSNTYRVISGTVPNDLRSIFDLSSAFEANLRNHDQIYREFKADSFQVRINRQWADLFISLWNGTYLPAGEPRETLDSAIYNITVSKIDQHTVRLKSNLTGEVVTYWRDNLSGFRFTSTNPTRGDIEYIPTENACPGDQLHDWYGQFMMENLRYPPDPELQ